MHLTKTLAPLTLLLCAAAPLRAHDWPSPSAAEQQQTQKNAWPGLRWAGPQAGRPAAPAALDCRRAPTRFSIADGEPRRSARPEPSARHERLRSAPAVAAEHRSADMVAMAPPPVEFKPAPPASPAAVAPPAARQRPAPEAVAAGMVDDNADFGAFTQFHSRHGGLLRDGLQIADRVRLDVRDAQGRAVPDAVVSLHAGGRELPLWARTDAGGQAWLMPQADLQAAAASGPWELEVSSPGRESARVRWAPGQKDALQLRLAAAEPPNTQRARLDIAFVIDATGSMGDEIDKLKASMRAVAAQIDRLPSRPDLCWSLVAYRDRGDEFFVRGMDFTARLDALQTELDGLQAGGGGDTPEAANEALHSAIHELGWRGDGTARLILHVADAPPQQHHGLPRFNDNARAALARGIKVMSIGASGLDRTGEVAMRQMAQFTGGRFVFLTYADARNPSAGPGRGTAHEVQNYSVETLDKLVVRLVSEEMARWPG